MQKFFLALFDSPNKIKYYLILTNILLAFFLILFSNLGMLPMKTGDFIFFALLVFALTLFRPGWAFLFFIGTIALENINLAPEHLGLVIRPYQLIGGLLFLGILIKFFSHKLNFKLIKLNWLDYLVYLIPLAGLLNILSSQSPQAGLKLFLVIFSFAIIFLITKNYSQNTSDLKKILPFFLSSSLVIIFYGFWQNIRFSKNLASFSVMPGRPNSTLSEPDWLGAYLLLILASLYALIYFFSQKYNRENKLREKINLLGSYFYLILVFALLVIVVSRSAWLGATVMTVAFLLLIFTNLKLNFSKWQWTFAVKIKLGIICAFLISLGAVYFFQLTSFQLFNRAISTGGTQKITVACPTNQCILPNMINNIDEIKTCDCRHINLEDIEKEKALGYNILEIYRKDPNVSVRAEVYRKSLLEIKDHPILGIGWENIPLALGKDERGANLNSSNLFLETYLGSGIIGFLSLIMILGTIFFRGCRTFFKESDLDKKTFALFVIISLLGLITFNLFNAGIMLGFFWVFLGVSSVLVVSDNS